MVILAPGATWMRVGAELDEPDDKPEPVEPESAPVNAATADKIAFRESESEPPDCPEPESAEVIAPVSCRLEEPATSPSPRDHLNGAALVNRTLCRKITPTRICLEADRSWNNMIQEEIEGADCLCNLAEKNQKDNRSTSNLRA